MLLKIRKGFDSFAFGYNGIDNIFLHDIKDAAYNEFIVDGIWGCKGCLFILFEINYDSLKFYNYYLVFFKLCKYLQKSSLLNLYNPFNIPCQHICKHLGILTIKINICGSLTSFHLLSIYLTSMYLIKI